MVIMLKTEEVVYRKASRFLGNDTNKKSCPAPHFPAQDSHS